MTAEVAPLEAPKSPEPQVEGKLSRRGLCLWRIVSSGFSKPSDPRELARDPSPKQAKLLSFAHRALGEAETMALGSLLVESKKSRRSERAQSC